MTHKRHSAYKHFRLAVEGHASTYQLSHGFVIFTKADLLEGEKAALCC